MVNEMSGGGGIRSPLKSPAFHGLSQPSGAESGAITPKSAITDPSLAALIAIWPKLPESIRTGVIAMIRAFGE
jgi:hypothetical protein